MSALITGREYVEKKGQREQRRTSLPSAIDSRKGHESTAEDEEVGEWKGEALPVNIEHFVGVGCGQFAAAV
jgi:hypothetical protein